jgi:hypothetical protein
MLIVKIIIAVLLGLIVLSLAVSMFSMIKDQENSDRTVKLLTIRIGLSIVTFIFIFISFYMGWIQPHGILPPSG